MLTRILSFPIIQSTCRPFFHSRNNIQHIFSRSKTAMPRLIGRALQEDITHTIIEDSEPEREAERALLKEQRRRRRAEAKRLKEEARAQRSNEVIIISDSERSIAHDLQPATSLKPIEPSFIEISDTTSPNASIAAAPIPQAPRTIHETIPSLSSDDGLRGILRLSPSLAESTDSNQEPPSNEINRPMDLAACMISTAYPDSPPRKLDLARFAFGGRVGPSTKPKPVPTRPENIPVQAVPKVSKKAVVDFPLADIFTTSQLAVLSKCVVCDLAWTTRKTVPVKLQHLKRCAKKNAWKEETVVLAMTEAIDREPATVAKDQKNKGKGKSAQSEDEVPKTYLEDLVNEAAPKKRRKKDAEVVTVVNPQDAHTEILKRAKALFPLASSEFSRNEPVPFPSTQAFGPSKLGESGTRVGVLGMGMFDDQTAPSGEQLENGNDAMRPSTQAFRPSVLGGAFAKHSILQHDDSITMEDEREMPSATQAFGKSALAERYGTSKRSMLHSEDSENESQVENRPVSPSHNPARPSNPIPSSSKLPPSRHLDIRVPLSSHSGNEEHLFLPTTAQMRLAALDRRLAGIHISSTTGQKRQEVQERFPIPPSVFEKLARARAQIEQEKENNGKGKPRSKGKEKASNNSSSSGASSRSRSRSRSSSKKIRKQRRRSRSRSSFEYHQEIAATKKGDRYNKDTLDREMRQIIIEDEELYMKILRFEPINFEIFFQEASRRGMDGRGLRLSLRAFLDRQAINFYGNVAGGPRRRY